MYDRGDDIPALSSGDVTIRKLERVRWQAGVAFESYGVRVGVRLNDEDLVDDVIARLPYGWQPARSSRVDQLFSLVAPEGMNRAPSKLLYRLYDRDSKLAAVPELVDALDMLESHMQIHVAEMAEDRVFLHAGVVGWEGRAILLPGRSYTGKTTLVRELVRAGATYYSDEYAVLDANGFVHPFARPLAIRTSSSRQEKHTVESLGGKAGTDPLPVGFVVLSEYRRRARWHPERLTQGQAVLELLNQAVPARRKPAVVLTTLEAVAARAPVVRIMRGEGRAIAPRILDLLEN